jgi:hypothetical protein
MLGIREMGKVVILIVYSIATFSECLASAYGFSISWLLEGSHICMKSRILMFR